KLVNFLNDSKLNCYAYYRKKKLLLLEVRPPFQSMFKSSRRRTKTGNKWVKMASFGKIYFIDSMSFQLQSRHCGKGLKIYRCSPFISSNNYTNNMRITIIYHEMLYVRWRPTH